MAMDLTQLKNFRNSIESLDSSSAFKVKMFDSGAYFQIANSNSQLHDIGFISLRDAFQTIKNKYAEISHYIEWCNKNPTSIEDSFGAEKDNFKSIIKRLNDGSDSPLTAARWSYSEKPLRVISEHYFPSSRIAVVGKEQSKLLFNAISRLIYCANNIPTASDKFDNVCPFSDQNIATTLAVLNEIIDFYDIGTRALPSLPIIAAHPGVNIIYYGAPGTGKSHTIDNEVDEANTVRTVFHADTTNSDFVGCLKPIMDGETIKYEFRPGPFTNAVLNAIKDLDHHHWLVIEEINRAPAAAVFGEIFQLLDREAGTGKSRYSITLSDIDMQTYIKDKSGNNLENGKLQLPGNLTLLATMNSSDQAVMPLDTAFKRRWQFRYIPLDFDSCSPGDLQFPDVNGITMETSWKNFAITINTILTEQGIPEDRHFGPFFLSESEISCNKKEVMTGKLFMYLWDDVLRHGMKETVFNSDIKTYGQLTRYFDNKKIFSDDFYQKLESLTTDQASVYEETEVHDSEESNDQS